MEVTTLSFSNIHEHGALFSNVLRARHENFITRNQWDLPQADGMEFDQYDTPASRWVAVHHNGQVMAGVRLTPTTHRCGIYSYMIKDAQDGLLETIPTNLLWETAPIGPHIWESSRVFVSRHVPARERMIVQMKLGCEMVNAAREVGATSLLGIVPDASRRLSRRFGIVCDPAGPIMDFDGVDCVCVNIALATKMH
ncbi:N-acyl-L-homoserine lactone synthetase [Thalassobacter stenotrophicus]|jgi:N-acyl-L-homoserine lactone synthetase|uniref:acyl-homoserine-lactone synthase n=1 Tax=Thalassobacter TaxID=266808 RepID=UPI00051D999D|nr:MULTISPECIES: acyl-homoserine-lactone synthase [Thalassobacter]KGK78342.1 N-acyl-L-homoserine lactone synthetase [Thalassobacter stenotrophicus]KGL00113.1 N-acyl-L-homoserine lactone synthetase [Thalassobacter sp. 16PALIMAR09]UYP68367.1 N-acyl-L-homoserine lactone synthetase [Thalassobacter stenotrophicus]